MDKERGHGRMVDAVDIDLRAALQEDGAVRDTLDSANSLRMSYTQQGVESGKLGRGGASQDADDADSDEEEFTNADLRASLDSSNVQFVDYCPFTFHAFRTSAGIGPDAYSTSLARPRNSRFKLGGTSGAFIFFSDDNRFVIKQIQTNEFNTLLKVLPSYLKHMRTHPESMLQHMYQLYASCTLSQPSSNLPTAHMMPRTDGLPVWWAVAPARCTTTRSTFSWSGMCTTLRQASAMRCTSGTYLFFRAVVLVCVHVCSSCILL
jgi:hypothetical protein